MEVVGALDPGEFLERATPLLLSDEARHNLIFGVAVTLRDQPGHYPEHRLWLVLGGTSVVAAAVRTPPHNLILACPGNQNAVEALASAIDEELPGVIGAVPEVETFASAWAAAHGVRGELRVAYGIYALDELIPPPPVSGTPRPASPEDSPLLRAWLRDFAREARGEEEDEERLERVLAARFARADAGFVLWEDGDPVSLAGFGGTTPNGTRIGPVYTPPDKRGRGYGSAVTAAVTAERLAAGRRFCFLYTDLANPTSNKIYVALGYRRVCDSFEIAFRRQA
jgi:uncharacterized protein